MCKAVEDYGKEIKEEMIIEMIKGEKLSLEEIASYSHLSVEAVKQIAEKVTVKA